MIARLTRRLPIFKLLMVVEVALLARRHLAHLDAADRQRLSVLVRRGRSMTATERSELRELAAKLEPQAFLLASADALSPLPLPKRLARAYRGR